MRSGKDALSEVVLKTSSEDWVGGVGVCVWGGWFADQRVALCKGSLAGKNDDDDE